MDTIAHNAYSRPAAKRARRVKRVREVISLIAAVTIILVGWGAIFAGIANWANEPASADDSTGEVLVPFTTTEEPGVIDQQESVTPTSDQVEPEPAVDPEPAVEPEPVEPGVEPGVPTPVVPVEEPVLVADTGSADPITNPSFYLHHIIVADLWIAVTTPCVNDIMASCFNMDGDVYIHDIRYTPEQLPISSYYDETVGVVPVPGLVR